MMHRLHLDRTASATPIKAAWTASGHRTVPRDFTGTTVPMALPMPLERVRGDCASVRQFDRRKGPGRVRDVRSLAGTDADSGGGRRSTARSPPPRRAVGRASTRTPSSSSPWRPSKTAEIWVAADIGLGCGIRRLRWRRPGRDDRLDTVARRTRARGPARRTEVGPERVWTRSLAADSGFRGWISTLAASLASRCRPSPARFSNQSTGSAHGGGEGAGIARRRRRSSCHT